MMQQNIVYVHAKQNSKETLMYTCVHESGDFNQVPPRIRETLIEGDACWVTNTTQASRKRSNGVSRHRDCRVTEHLTPWCDDGDVSY